MRKAGKPVVTLKNTRAGWKRQYITTNRATLKEYDRVLSGVRNRTTLMGGDSYTMMAAFMNGSYSHEELC